MTFFKTPKCDPRDQDTGLGIAESVDGELFGDVVNENDNNITSANSLPSDTVINDHVASVVMVDEGTDGDELTMDEVSIEACDEENIAEQCILSVKMNK